MDWIENGSSLPQKEKSSPICEVLGGGGGEELEMSSTALSSSFGTTSRNTKCKPRRLLNCHNRNLITSTVKVSNSRYFNQEKLQVKAKPALFGRREAIGAFGVSFAALEGVLSQLLQASESAAAEGGGGEACELSVAASGLAFCDKVVGFGPEAVKGQLIKVTAIFNAIAKELVFLFTKE